MRKSTGIIGIAAAALAVVLLVSGEASAFGRRCRGGGGGCGSSASCSGGSCGSSAGWYFAGGDGGCSSCGSAAIIVDGQPAAPLNLSPHRMPVGSMAVALPTAATVNGSALFTWDASTGAFRQVGWIAPDGSMRPIATTPPLR